MDGRKQGNEAIYFWGGSQATTHLQPRPPRPPPPRTPGPPGSARWEAEVVCLDPPLTDTGPVPSSSLHLPSLGLTWSSPDLARMGLIQAAQVSRSKGRSEEARGPLPSEEGSLARLFSAEEGQHGSWPSLESHSAGHGHFCPHRPGLQTDQRQTRPKTGHSPGV